MSSQNDFRLSDASSKSQARPRSITNSTSTLDSAIDLSDGLGSGSRKRKRDGSTMEDLLKDSFVVRPYPPKAPVKCRTLQPLLLLPRTQLPLSSLDILSSSSALPKSRLFETHIKILELEERMGNQPMVLIARLDDGRTLYAVEREDRGLYVILKLGSWVNIQQLRAVAAVSRQETSQAEKGVAPQINTPVLTAPDSRQFSKKKRLAIEAIQSMVKRPTTGLLTESLSDLPIEQESIDKPEVANAAQTSQDGQSLCVDVARQLTAAEILENVRTQYFDALYLSNASLAYFAKGPLSRARAAFHLDYDSTLEMNDLITFLESLILSTTLLDKKYRDGLPNCVSMIDIEHHSANDVGNSKHKKKRSIRKMKPGKNGLYPSENDLIRRWWETHNEDFESGIPGITRDDIAKNRISHLRIRETQLQMILILEVIALRPLASVVEDTGTDLPGDLPKSAIESKTALSKTKKPDHLTVLIDVHIDRLCIWQSIASEMGKSMAGDSQTSEASKHSDNIPRDFCVDIIAPFFSSRLPERCAMINKKLGGPISISPPKPKISTSAVASGTLSKPGAATKRPVPVKPRQSLTRVLTDERERERRSASSGPNRKISLMRSATMPAVPGLKREGSEAPSLSNFMAAESQPIVAANRGGVLNSKRFAQREVDLNSLSSDPNAKARKQATIDSELKEAIAALRKPNRELAGKSFAEIAEQRIHPRKSKKPVRNPLFQGVQISATPKAHRQMDIFGNPQAPGLSKTEPFDFAAVTSSNVPIIPQSSLPSQGKKPIKNPFLSSVQATPTRKSLSVSQYPQGGPSPIGFGGFLPSSPVHARRSSASLFPAIPESALKTTSQTEIPLILQETPVKTIARPENLSILQETPVKKRADTSIEHNHQPVLDSESNKENSRTERGGPSEQEAMVNNQSHELSIYKALGWDDVDDIDELA